MSPGEGVGPSVCQHLGPGITAFESPWEQVKCMFPCVGLWKETLWSLDLGLCVWHSPSHFGGYPGGSMIKNLPANAGDLGSVPGSGRTPGGGHGNPLQDSCLGNPMDRGAWQGYSPWSRKESDTTERLNKASHFYRHHSVCTAVLSEALSRVNSAPLSSSCLPAGIMVLS